ncbi:MAG: hypothetical protein ACTSRZ_18730 [Promethearchaeota archaeon]
MRCQKATKYPYLEKARIPLNSIFDQNGALRMDKLELLFKRKNKENGIGNYIMNGNPY